MFYSNFSFFLISDHLLDFFSTKGKKKIIKNGRNQEKDAGNEIGEG